MVSIQSLMSSNPYENEPGYENRKKDEPNPRAYVEKIRHETIRIAVCQRLEGLLGLERQNIDCLHLPKRPRLEGSFSPVSGNTKAAKTDDSSGSTTPDTEAEVHEYNAEETFNALDSHHWDPFADLMKRRFLWYHDTYISTVEDGMKQHKQGEPFKLMEFEYGPNNMSGKFEYPSLRKRLDSIKTALIEEEQQWVKQGLREVSDSTQIATMLAFQFKQLEHKWNDSQYDSSRLEISLPDKTNPFVWHLTLFGKPMTDLDGGIFNMSLHIPPTFPTSQPRVRIQTPIFHHRVSKDGVLCYFPKKEDEIAMHLEAIVAAIEDVQPKYDPRAVLNPEAFGLFWGGPDKRKVYNRKLRRSAQDSSEYA
jgi:ubiquitin-conjugating enzyme E2 Z